MVPDCVPGVMDHEKILCLQVRGMENRDRWGYLSVCATSSHDVETLRMQFPSDPQPLQVYDELYSFLKSPSMLAIFPLQDWLALDAGLRRPERGEERINQPADPDHHWRFRLHLDLRDLVGNEAFCDTVADMVKASGR